MLRLAFAALLLAPCGACIQTLEMPDAGPSDGGVDPCANDYDPTDGYRFDCPLVLDDAHFAAVSDPATLPMGTRPCHAPQQARVVRGVDGDTLRVAILGGGSNVDVRLIGVNAPEIMHPPDPTPAQCYGPEAAAFTDTALVGRMVWLTYGETCLDPYGRTLAFIHLGPKPNDSFQRQLQRRGLSRIFTFSDNPDFAATFQSDQDAATASHTGLWGACP